MSLFVVCEGLDGAGKTTVMQEAIRKLGKKPHHGIVHCEDIVRCVYNKGLCSDTLSGRVSRILPCTLTLLIDLVYQTYFIIKPCLKRGKTVFQDRYDLSVLSYPTARRWHNKLFAALLKPFLIKPDILVYFTVSEKERIRRLKQTRRNKYHSQLIRNPRLIRERENKIEELYSSFGGRKTRIDTTNRKADECGNELITKIRQFL